MRKSLIYFILSLVVLNTACTNDDNEKSSGTPEIGELNLASPLENSTCEGNSISTTKCEVTLAWNPISGVDSYTLTLINLETNKVRLIQNDIKTTTYKVTLDKNVPYSWKITSDDKVTKEVNNTSPVWKFYTSAGVSVVNYAPFPADLITPIQDKIVTAVDGKITLKWIGSDTDSNGLKYTVYLDKIDGKQTPAAELTNIVGTQANVAVTSGVYYWRVKTSDANSSSFSQIVSFTVN